jgi:outer membrane protein
VKYFWSIAIISLLAAGFPSGTLFSQAKQTGPIKIGFVNSSKILLEYRDAQEANKKLDALATKWRADLDQMSKDLQAKYEEFQKKEALMPEAQKQSAREELAMLEQKGMQYRQQKFANDGELAAATDSLLGPIKKHVLSVINDVAKKEGLQFIFDRNDQITVLLYGDEKFDYTNFVIDKLKRGSN